MVKTQKVLRQIIFEKETQAFDNSKKIREILLEYKYAFLDREYDNKHRIRIRGIHWENEGRTIRELRKCIDCEIQEDRPLELFENYEQFGLYSRIHHDLDILWFPHFFSSNKPLEEVISFALYLANTLTVTKDEGYNSHLSHFWGFFHFIDRRQQTGIAELFQNRYRNLKLKDTDKRIYVDEYLSDIEVMLEKGNINFYSPGSLDEILNGNQFASVLHEKTIRNAKQMDFLYSKYNICSKWVLNALYVAMILMNIPVIDRFFMNYAVSMEKYPMDEICQYYLRTGEEKLWMREDGK